MVGDHVLTKRKTRGSVCPASSTQPRVRLGESGWESQAEARGWEMAWARRECVCDGDCDGAGGALDGMEYPEGA